MYMYLSHASNMPEQTIYLFLYCVYMHCIVQTTCFVRFCRRPPSPYQFFGHAFFHGAEFIMQALQYCIDIYIYFYFIIMSSHMHNSPYKEDAAWFLACSS